MIRVVQFSGGKDSTALVLVTLGEIKRLDQTLPEVWDRAAELEVEAGEGRTFFPPEYIPYRFCTGRADDGTPIPTLNDVKLYVRGSSFEQLALIDLKRPSGCMSVYNLCE